MICTVEWWIYLTHELIVISNYGLVICAVNFAVQSLKQKSNAILEGACRKAGRGFPYMCKQEEVKGDDNIREAIWVIKVAKLVVEGTTKIIVAASVYDSKPVYFWVLLAQK